VKIGLIFPGAEPQFRYEPVRSSTYYPVFLHRTPLQVFDTGLEKLKGPPPSRTTGYTCCGRHDWGQRSGQTTVSIVWASWGLLGVSTFITFAAVRGLICAAACRVLGAGPFLLSTTVPHLWFFFLARAPSVSPSPPLVVFVLFRCLRDCFCGRLLRPQFNWSFFPVLTDGAI